MPDNVVSKEPFKVILYVEDPLMRELADKIVIGGYGECTNLRWGNKQVSYEYDYNGEEKIEFESVAVYREMRDNHECNLTISFLGNNEEIMKKYPQIKSIDQNLGFVSKTYNIMPVSFTADLPKIEDGDFKKEYWDTTEFPPEALFYQTGNNPYSLLQTFRFMMGKGACWQKYEKNFACGNFNDEFISNPGDGSIIEEMDLGTFGSSGKSKGYVLWDIKKSDAFINDGKTIEEGYNVEIYMAYEVLVNDFLFYSGDVRKIYKVKKDDYEKSVEESKTQILNTIKSQRWFSKGGETKSYKSTYKPNLPDLKQDSIKVWGTIADADNNPMPFIKIQLELKGKVFIGYSDENGDFSIPITDLKLSDNEEANMFIFLEYFRNGKTYYKLYMLNGNYKEIWFYQKVKIENKQDVELHIVLDGSQNPDTSINYGSVSNIKHLSVIYYHFHEAVDFALKKLNIDLDYKLPVEVLIGNTNGDTLYSPSESRILISLNDAGYSSTDRPKNREYHEFAHAIMYDLYGDWPEDIKMQGTKNHDGLINPSTADSYVEGFAEFLAMAIAKENGDRNPDIYASFGSLEKNYHPWDGKGYGEEFAVASLLWDMYDNKNDKGDSLTMSIEDIWAVLKTKRNNFYEYYKAFKESYPRKANEIDNLFIEHGFFADTTIGNKKWDLFEPIRDKNQNGIHDLNETFVDLGALNSTDEIIYKKSYVIGKAADYSRLNRTNAVRVPGSYLEVGDKITFYNVNVKDEKTKEEYNYIVDARQGKIYIQPLPSDDTSIITITPKTEAYTFDKPFIISNKELLEKIYQTTGQNAFQKHDFNLKPTGKKDNETFFMAKPTYNYQGDIGKEVEIKIDERSNNLNSKIKTGFNLGKVLFWLIIISLFSVFTYSFIKKPNFRNKVISNTKTGAKKTYDGFKKHGIPFIKKTIKIIIEILIKIGKFLIDLTKKAYHKSKPHLKKVHEKIKNKLNKKK